MRLCVRDAGVRRAIAQGTCLYVGRPAQGGLEGSPLANPFKAVPGQPGATIPAYRKWLWGRIQAGDGAVLEALGKVHEVGAVACWCPEHRGQGEDTCHGQQVLRAAAWLAKTHDELVAEMWAQAGLADDRAAELAATIRSDEESQVEDSHWG